MNAAPHELDPLELERIPAHSFVRRVEFHHHLTSTNDRALECVRDEGETPLLVLAATQTRGRGRGKNQWWADRGALTFSLLIEPARLGLSPEQLPQISLATALGVCDALRQWAPPESLRVKWPNDVYVSGRKIAGILLERTAARSDRLVIGVGVNVNNSLSQAPPAVRTVATALCDAGGERVAIHDVLLALLQEIAARCRRLGVAKQSLAAEWEPHCLLRGRRVEVAQGEQLIAGDCRGIDDHGALLVQSRTGVHRLFSGVVRRVI